jgi:hypothetical protein
MDEQGLTPEERQRFEELGYLLIPGAVPAELVERLGAIIVEHAKGLPAGSWNRSDAFSLDPEFLELADLPKILPKVRDLLGTNIWINHTHANWDPPVSAEDRPRYGWHRDGGEITNDLPYPAPIMLLKVGFYLTDLLQPGMGQTYVIPGSHQRDMRVPGVTELPEDAVPILCRAGDAILYDFRTIHSVKSPNLSEVTRRAAFLQYAYRWIFPMSPMSVEQFEGERSPIRRQLLGLSTSSLDIGGVAQGRSTRFYPLGDDLALRDGIQQRGRTRGWAARLRRLFGR